MLIWIFSTCSLKLFLITMAIFSMRKTNYNGKSILQLHRNNFSREINKNLFTIEASSIPLLITNKTKQWTTNSINQLSKVINKAKDCKTSFQAKTTLSMMLKTWRQTSIYKIPVSMTLTREREKRRRGECWSWLETLLTWNICRTCWRTSTRWKMHRRIRKCCDMLIYWRLYFPSISSEEVS